MKLIRFSLPDQLDAWEALESEPGITIEGHYPFAGFVVVRYSIPEERVNLEHEDLQLIHGWADRLAGDTFLPTLKNATQRELYLLEKHSLDSHTAGKVWEYIKMKEKKKEGNN